MNCGWNLNVIFVLTTFLAAVLSLAVPDQQINFTAYQSSNGVFEWISSIFRPPGTVNITTPPTECMECTCGTINTYRRIVGGQESEVHEYPWMALLLMNGQFYCGASLINNLYVATAAHCLSGFNQGFITVRLLEHNRKNSSAEVINRQAAWISIHERYNPRTFDNDIALIRLSSPVTFNDILRPVCMPDSNKTYEREIAIVTGWGALSEGGQVSSTLQEVPVPVLSQEACRMSNYGSSGITENMLCAGYAEGGKDSCQGDSGGPLHVESHTKRMQYQLGGIVSWGEGCARPNSPGVYTRVSRYIEWIADRTKNACTCSESTDME